MLVVEQFTFYYESSISSRFQTLVAYYSIRLFEKKSPRRTFSKKKMVLIAQQVEISLYREAESLDAYLNKATLQNRMRQIAINSIRESTIQLITNINLDCNCSVRLPVADQNNNPNTTPPTTLENFESLSLRRR